MMKLICLILALPPSLPGCAAEGIKPEETQKKNLLNAAHRRQGRQVGLSGQTSLKSTDVCIWPGLAPGTQYIDFTSDKESFAFKLCMSCPSQN